MSQIISITSGSKSILTNIINKYPEHQLYLYKSSTENNYQLIDWFTNNVLFKLPITYNMIKSSKNIKFGPFINLIFLTLNAKQKKLLSAYINHLLTLPLPSNLTSLSELQALENPSKIMIITSWQSSNYYLTWLKQSFIFNFIHNPNNNSFHNNLIQIR